MGEREQRSQPSIFERFSSFLFHGINKFVPWYKLPGILGIANLSVLRSELRNSNLHDGYGSGEAQGNAHDVPLEDERYRKARHSDGKFNSLERPLTGCSGIRFGRNFPREQCQRPTEEELWTPNPKLVSDRFMARKEAGFIPATTLNLLAAAWIQFQTHDWFNHELLKSDESFDIPLPEGDNWGGGSMKLPKTKTDDVLHPSDRKCRGYKNMNTGWWDGSQIYGSSEAVTASLRGKGPDGKLVMAEENGGTFLPLSEDGNVQTGFTNNWWIGIELLHTLFALEHNAICDELRKEYPNMTGDDIFDKARLVNCALMAKIHTIEWTPAILGHPTLKIAMNVNWWGIAGETLTKLLGNVFKNEIISGIPGSGANEFGIPYSLTEEFVSVYRMHSLMPDNIAFFSSATGEHGTTVPVPDVSFSKSRSVFQGDASIGLADVFYSFGINYPGAITNNNYPDFLRNLTTPDDAVRRDLGTVDIVRDRERGVPRYNAFRRMLRMKAPATFEELAGGDKELAAELADVYGGDIEKVDSLVGCHSEPLIPGFGFSETAFRIFILMASRRLESDRFIATQWNAETYTKAGFKWVQNTTMKDVLLRHFPELKAVIDKSSGNVFAPWGKLEASKSYTGVETSVSKTG